MSDINDLFMISSSDQEEEHVRKLARTVAIYHKELLRQGLDPEDAIELTGSAQTMLWMQALGISDSDDEDIAA